MGLRKEKYNDEKIEKLFKYIQTYADRGQPIEYEVKVDDFSAVRRTDDPALFHDFADFVDGSTRSIEIIFYSGLNNHSLEKYIFTFQEEAKPQEGLSGIEIKNKIQEEVNIARKEWEFDQLKRDLEKSEKYAKELEEEVEELEKELDEIKGNQSPLEGILGEFGSSFVSGLVRQNPKMLQKIPALSGLVEPQGNTTKEESEPAAFEPSQEENPEAKEALELVRYLKSKMSEEQFAQTMTILDLLCKQPEKIEGILRQLNG